MTDNIEYIRDKIPPKELLAQLAEEASELAKAALKLRRTYDQSNPTPVTREKAFDNVVEEIADVMLCLRVLGFDLDPEEYEDITGRKAKRWVSRLRKGARP